MGSLLSLSVCISLTHDSSLCVHICAYVCRIEESLSLCVSLSHTYSFLHGALHVCEPIDRDPLCVHICAFVCRWIEESLSLCVYLSHTLSHFPYVSVNRWTVLCLP